MKQFFFLFALFLSFEASAQMLPGTPRKKYLRPKKDEECAYVLNVTKNTDEEAEVTASVTRLAYRPYAELLTEITELRRMNNWADSTYQRKLQALPTGGVLVVTMYRRGAQNADPALLSVTARDKAGKELLTVPTLPEGQGRFWNRDLYMSKRTIPFVKIENQSAVIVTLNDAKLKQDFEYIVNVQ